MPYPFEKTSSDVEHPDKLLVPDEVFIISIEDDAYNLNNIYGKALKPNPEGVYLSSSLLPVLRPGQELVEAVTGKTYGVDNVMEAKNDLSNESGEVVISSYHLKNKNRYLSTKGFYPVSAIQLLKIVIDKNLRRFCKYSMPFTIGETSFYQYITDEYKKNFNQALLEDFSSERLDQIYDFVKKDRWRMYFTRVRRNNLYIEKCVDYRIYEWTRQQYELLHPEDNE